MSQTIPVNTSRDQMLKWQYNVVTCRSPGLSWQQLDEFGKDGWDLVSVIPPDNNISLHERYIFKKPISR